MGNKKNVKIKKEDLDKIPIELRDTLYSNGIRIFGGQYEFALEFFQQPMADTGSFEGIRIIINPLNLKMFNKFIEEQIGEYEKEFGEIVVKEEQHKGQSVNKKEKRK
ncbi:MAG: DUF3467 domain-containing protein [Candidatus Thermoplasmatota archaeon]|nr:DUF3467 domain-containing protein [Candidatus Thermoplasmatota archaeon]